MSTTHLLLEPPARAAVARAATEHHGVPWASDGFTDLDDRASHPCGIFHGGQFSVFAKLVTAPDAADQVGAELAALALLRHRAGVETPTPVAGGSVVVPAGILLLLEALPERAKEARASADWRAIGRAFAALHGVTAEQFGAEPSRWDGYFGPLHQDNRPVPSNRWADFYGERRVLPNLRQAVDSGHLTATVAAGVERVVGRLPELCGPEPRPSLLHGDAQQNNIVSTAAGAVLVDPSPYFGHPELDLALVDIFEPVPATVFDAYREVRPIDPGFADRRELWRIFGYLAAVAVEGSSAFGRRYAGKLADAVHTYR